MRSLSTTKCSIGKCKSTSTSSYYLFLLATIFCTSLSAFIITTPCSNYHSNTCILSPRRTSPFTRRVLLLLSSSSVFDDAADPSERTTTSDDETSSTSSSHQTFYVPNVVSRSDGQQIMDDILMPSKKYGDRIGWGRDAHDLSGLIASDDPRLGMTYGEFPLCSFDSLLDLGLDQIQQQRRTNEDNDNDDDTEKRKTVLVDLGSGCGRLVLYSALTRGGGGQSEEETKKQRPWEVHGIEIAQLLHEEGLKVIINGIENGWFSQQHVSTTQSEDNQQRQQSNFFSLHLGPVEEYTSLLNDADIIFAYSTAFPAETFSTTLGAMILGVEWSQLLSEACKEGCVAITTDRALDPTYGWNLLERLDVDNKEVFGSTGYIHVLKK